MTQVLRLCPHLLMPTAPIHSCTRLALPAASCLLTPWPQQGGVRNLTDQSKDRFLHRSQVTWLGEVDLLPINTHIFNFFFWILLRGNRGKPEQTKPLISEATTQTNQQAQILKYFGKTFLHFTRFSFTPSLQVSLLSLNAASCDADSTQSFK